MVVVVGVRVRMVVVVVVVGVGGGYDWGVHIRNPKRKHKKNRSALPNMGLPPVSRYAHRERLRLVCTGMGWDPSAITRLRGRVRTSCTHRIRRELQQR